MNNFNERKEFMRSSYSQFWHRTRVKYGNQAESMKYDKDLIHELTKSIKNGKILEIAIGDGFPYSNVLDEMRYEVSGIDISLLLIPSS
jgi:hypothetical protein